MSDKYFPCKIYNTNEENYPIKSRRGDHPAFAVLSMENDFGIEQAKSRIRKIKPKNIFIIINGQQSLNIYTDDIADARFGQALTGSDRISDKDDDCGIWKGDFKIHITDSYKSVASTLFDEYGSRDLIIDIVNAKYEWDETKTKNSLAFSNFIIDLQDILDPINNKSNLRFCIIGFSRGGMFALRLTKWLKEHAYGKEKIVITIDPVQRWIKEKDWDISWAYWNRWKQKWEQGNRADVGLNDFTRFFPILKAVGEKHYNVFERDTWNSGGSVNLPIGCAVEGAFPPPQRLTGNRKGNNLDWYNEKSYNKLPSCPPYSQFDILTQNHTSMPVKYKDWVIDVVHDNFSTPEIFLTPSQGDVWTKVKITGTVDEKYSVFIENKKIPSQWHEKDKYLSFNVPKIKGGKKYISVGKDKYKIASKLFIFRPFISSAVPPRVIPKLTITLVGVFKKKGCVFFAGEKIDSFIYKSDTKISFEVSKNISPGIKTVHMEYDNCISNAWNIIVCDLIGNTNTKELHKLNCKWLHLMKPSNKRLLYSKLDNPKKYGWDNCHWCIGGSTR